MTKTELIDSVAEQLGLAKADAQRTLEGVLDCVGRGLVRDRKVQIQGFGTFLAKERKARMGRNPQTNQPIQIPASVTVSFRPGQALKDRL